MRKLAYSALRDDDTTSIAILAAVVIQEPQNVATHPAVEQKQGYCGCTPSEYSVLREEMHDQFKELFSLDDEGFEAIRKKGEEEIEKSKWEIIKALSDQTRQQGCAFPFLPTSPFMEA
jgi:hypothetical protein